MDNETKWILGLSLSGSALAFIALADLPIGFYTFLRLVISGICIAYIILYYSLYSSFSVILLPLILVAFMFNPLVPVYLKDKSAWSVIDIIVGIILFAYAVLAFVKSKGIPNLLSKVKITKKTALIIFFILLAIAAVVAVFVANVFYLSSGQLWAVGIMLVWLTLMVVVAITNQSEDSENEKARTEKLLCLGCIMLFISFISVVISWDYL